MNYSKKLKLAKFDEHPSIMMWLRSKPKLSRQSFLFKKFCTRALCTKSKSTLQPCLIFAYEVWSRSLTNLFDWGHLFVIYIARENFFTHSFGSVRGNWVAKQVFDCLKNTTPTSEYPLRRSPFLQKSMVILPQAFLPDFGGVKQYILLFLYCRRDSRRISTYSNWKAKTRPSKNSTIAKNALVWGKSFFFLLILKLHGELHQLYMLKFMWKCAEFVGRAKRARQILNMFIFFFTEVK